MNFNNNNNKCIVSIHNNTSHHHLAPPNQPAPPPPPPPPPLNPQQSLSSYSSASSNSSSSSSSSNSSSQFSNYLQPKPSTTRNNFFSTYDTNHHPVYNSSSCSFSTNNLNRLKSAQFNVYQKVNNNTNSANQQSQTNNYSQQRLIAGSMRNINELLINTNNLSTTTNAQQPKAANNLDKENLNYSNLQQALRAATAALQKSKMPTNIVTSQPMSKSNINLASNETTGQQLSFQPYTKSQDKTNTLHKRIYKNSVNLKIENKGINCSEYDNIEDNIDISVNLANCTKPLEETNLLDETVGRKQHTEAASNETVSTFSSPSSVSSSNKSVESRTYISETMNQGKLINSQKLNEFYADSPSEEVYREIGVDCEESVIAEINIAPIKPVQQIHHVNNYNFGIVSQKSASIDHLNLASCFAKPHTNKNITRKKSANNSQNPVNNPPPNIQPYSGVLSKSLHSLVLKPQPLKPVLEQNGDVNHPSLDTLPSNNINNNNKSLIKPVLGGKDGSCFSNQQNTNYGFLKSKCASTTNLVLSSSAQASANNYNKPRFSIVAAKSVNFNKLSESDDSLDIDETASSTTTSDSTTSERSSNGQQVEIVVDNNKCLEERLGQLQLMYDDLKVNFEKNLERDVRVAEMLKRSQVENNELRVKLERERMRFEAERAEWMAEKEKVLQFQGYLQREVKTKEKKEPESLGQAQAKKTLASHMQFLQQKLTLGQCNQQSHQQGNQKKDIYKSQQQFVPSKLFQQSLLLAKSSNVNSSTSVNSVNSQSSNRLRHQQINNNFL